MGVGVGVSAVENNAVWHTHTHSVSSWNSAEACSPAGFNHSFQCVDLSVSLADGRLLFAAVPRRYTGTSHCRPGDTHKHPPLPSRRGRVTHLFFLQTLRFPDDPAVSNQKCASDLLWSSASVWFPSAKTGRGVAESPLCRKTQP